MREGDTEMTNQERYVGKIFDMYDGFKIQVIDYKNKEEVMVQFENGYTKSTSILKIKSGHIKNELYINNMKNKYTGKVFLTREDYKVRVIDCENIDKILVEFENRHKTTTTEFALINGLIKNCSSRRHDSSEVWNSMFDRCYNRTEYNRCHEGCTVADAWRNNKNFSYWYNKNVYDTKNIQTMVLDKDILKKGNRVYSAETCLILPGRINTAFKMCPNRNTAYPIGVSDYEGKYKAYFRGENLGAYDTPYKAFECYKNNREAYIRKLAANFWTSLSEGTKKREMPQRVYDNLMNYKVEITDLK